MPAKPCIAVVSPFLDRQHGTERCTIEQVERLARDYGYEIHLFCQSVEDLENVEPWPPSAATPRHSRIFWHKVSAIPGPHLVRFLWWLAANRFRRWRDSRRDLQFDLLYSPGINSSDADAISVHIVFHEFYQLVRDELHLHRLPVMAWPRALHRKLYYRLIMALEKRIYTNRRFRLAAVSGWTARQLSQYFGRTDVAVIPCGVDARTFNPAARKAQRTTARQKFAFGEEEIVFLLVGNDWKKKGLTCLLQALAECRNFRWKLLVAGQDDRTLYCDQIARLNLTGRIHFAAPSSDVVQFYAAADAYTGPSLEDAFALPVLEAMACGLPVIASARAGVTEIIHDGMDALVLRDPRDAGELARLLRRLLEEPELRRRLAENAPKTAQNLNWERDAGQTKLWLDEVIRERRCGTIP